MSVSTLDFLAQLQSAVTPLEKIEILHDLADNRVLEAIAPLLELLQHHHPEVLKTTGETLTKLAPESVEPLIKEYESCVDQNVQARIVQILANIGDDRALELLVAVVGVAIANHCQGNVRRVAARGLGKMVTTRTENSQMSKAIDKLNWALCNAEDWALRYACALSLTEIAEKNISEQISSRINDKLQITLSQESDPVVKARLGLLLS